MLKSVMNASKRFAVAGILVVATQGLANREAFSQQGITNSMPASAVMNRSGSDGWQSQGGVVGPWWTGSSTAATPPVGSGGFWFGMPGLGFGGSQGSTRGMGAMAPSVTTTNGATGFLSSSRLTPFVSGVVPVVGTGYQPTQAMPSPVLTPTSTAYRSLSTLPAGPLRAGYVLSPRPAPPGTITPEARDRVKNSVAAGDRHLRGIAEGPAAAKAALAEYRSAARFARDDADFEIRQAILYEALGKRRDADRAIDRAMRIDRRLAGTIETASAEAGGFLAPPEPGAPCVAVRGFAILRELQAPVEPSASESPSSPVIDWLSEAWARRWGLSAAPTMLPSAP